MAEQRLVVVEMPIQFWVTDYYGDISASVLLFPIAIISVRCSSVGRGTIPDAEFPVTLGYILTPEKAGRMSPEANCLNMISDL